MYYLAVFFAGFIFLGGLFAIRKWIYALIENTIGLLNKILDSRQDEDVKQKNLIHGLGKLMGSLVIVFLALGLVLMLSAAPFLLYKYSSGIPYSSWDDDSFYFYAILGVGSLVPFFIFKATTKKKDYSEWSVLLHRIALDNYNLSRYLFGLEKRWFKKKLVHQPQDFVIVSGLARAGTTALTTALHATGKFHSLSYANMPFILSPNIWAKVYKPQESNLRERSHGDKVLFGYNSVEALEEFFWKVQFDDSFISSDKLMPHTVEGPVYDEYIAYQNMLRSSSAAQTMYLAKNNNFILRYPSLRAQNKDFKVIFLFRDPVDHAYSLLNQHNRYCKFQQEDPFILEYMNWLGHHEFGLNHKSLTFTETRASTYDPSTLNYWIQCWIAYYSRLLLLIRDDSNALLIDYYDFANQPERTFTLLEQKLNLEFGDKPNSPFEGTKRTGMEVEATLMEQAQEVYRELVVLKK